MNRPPVPLDYVMARLFEIAPPVPGEGARSPEEIVDRVLARFAEETRRANAMVALWDEARNREDALTGYAEKRFRDGVEAAAKVAHDCAAEYDETGDDDSAGVAMAVAGAIEELAAKPVPPGVGNAKPLNPILYNEDGTKKRPPGPPDPPRVPWHDPKG